jgi:protein TonB
MGKGGKHDRHTQIARPVCTLFGCTPLKPSPVQPGRSRSWLILVAAGLAAVISWSVQQSPFEAPERDLPSSPRAERAPSPVAAELPAVRAKGSLVQLFGTDDYPAEALRREEQGTVAFMLAINRHGRVRRCTIVTGSGSEALDRRTCRILKRRARFEPARDARGGRVADTTTCRIRWELPDD